ncbi:hypothetical protein PT974_05066 [Cladobotryum mycophilum]|uniref:Zn(2)-C6 fungal-type domain-containing protein n=1 Tax=Cladobotryum mycophilum TaxID=491253 RepID=A0ABR0SQZ0_9HYPO
MAGVPTYRGCDACRGQKKKCDQAKPACSRCTRLNIPCVGCGQIRYKFKDHSGPPKKGRRSSSPASSTKSKSASPSPSLSPTLSNQVTVRSSSFISLLEIRDPRYDLTSYGVFFRDLPRRLGTNEALDAAVDVMASSYSYLRTRQSSKESLVKYVNALQALQRCLSDPEMAKKSETLCAIYIIMICQGWTGRDGDQKTTHGEGLAHLLDAATSRRNLDEFETLIRDTLYVPVLLESICNPKLRLSQWYSRLKQQAYDSSLIDEDQGTLVAGPFMHLAKIPDFINDPVTHLDNIMSSYQQLRREMPEKKQALQGFEAMMFSDGPKDMSSYDLAKIHIQYQILWGLLLMAGLVYNGFLRALGADDGFMEDEAIVMANDAVELAKSASIYRPLGASFVPMCLIPAWAATDDQGVQMNVVKALEAYRADFTQLTARSWYVLATWLKGEYDLLRMGLPPSGVECYNEETWGTMVLDDEGNHLDGGIARNWFEVS